MKISELPADIDYSEFLNSSDDPRAKKITEGLRKTLEHFNVNDTSGVFAESLLKFTVLNHTMSVYPKDRETEILVEMLTFFLKEIANDDDANDDGRED